MALEEDPEAQEEAPASEALGEALALVRPDIRIMVTTGEGVLAPDA